MTDTVLAIARRVTDTIGAEAVTDLASPTDPAAATIRSLMNRMGREIARRRNAWGNPLDVFVVDSTLDIVANQSTYVLPDGFVMFVEGTLWREGDDWPLTGPVASAAEWENLVRWGTAAATAFYWRRARHQGRRAVQLWPVPTAPSTLRFRYVTDHWVRRSSDGDAPTLPGIDSNVNVPLPDDDLVERGLLWAYRQNLGLEYRHELADYQIVLDRHLAQDPGEDGIVRPGRSASASGRWADPIVPAGSWGIR